MAMERDDMDDREERVEVGVIIGIGEKREERRERRRARGRSYSSSLVTLENSPFWSLVSQKRGLVSVKPCLRQPSSLTW